MSRNGSLSRRSDTKETLFIFLLWFSRLILVSFSCICCHRRPSLVQHWLLSTTIFVKRLSNRVFIPRSAGRSVGALLNKTHPVDSTFVCCVCVCVWYSIDRCRMKEKDGIIIGWVENRVVERLWLFIYFDDGEGECERVRMNRFCPPEETHWPDSKAIQSSFSSG